MGEEKERVVAESEAAKKKKKQATEEKPDKEVKESEKSPSSAEKKKTEEDKDKDKDKEKEEAGKDQTPPPPPPQEIVLRVYMHCEGCARKVKKSLKGFDGVEDVITDCKTGKVIVKGEKADPMKVLDRVQRKSHRNVQLLSPIPKPPSPANEADDDGKKSDQKETVKAEDDKPAEPKVITMVLKVHMHCEACAQEIKKRIERIKEVEVAIPDLKNSEVTVKGTIEPDKLVELVYKRTGKHALVIKQDPPPSPSPPEGAENKEEGKGKEGEAKEEKKGEEEEEEKEAAGEGGGAPPPEDGKVVELRANEYYYFPPKYALEMYAYPYPPPQIFSDENPNACAIM